MSQVRFIILFSSIIPISLRVNLDMAKTVYSFVMMRARNTYYYYLLFRILLYEFTIIIYVPKTAKTVHSFI